MLTRAAIFILITLLSARAHAQKAVFRWITSAPAASFRGLDVISDKAAWVSGSKGWVGITTDGGLNWNFRRVPRYEKCDFRTLHALNDHEAIIANAGSPAYILRTSDGGLTWQKVYENKDTAAFLDGAAFWNKNEGIIYGDPINRQLLLLRTTDGGRTWKSSSEKEMPMLHDGEASFAASGTTIRALGRKGVLIATGGKASRIFTSHNRAKSWNVMSTPILQGRSSTGIFTLLAISRKHWVIAGGDYVADTLNDRNIFFTTDAGKTWTTPSPATRGYRECLTIIGKKKVIAVGPTGLDISTDNGTSWRPLSDERQLHVLKSHGKLIVAAGSAGRLATLTLTE